MTDTYAAILNPRTLEAIAARLRSATRLDNLDGKVVDTGIPVYKDVVLDYVKKQILVRYMNTDNYIQLVGPVV